MTSSHDWLFVPGRVLRIFSSATRPPKEKLVILVATKPVLIGFFINTEPTPFQRKRPHLMDEMIELNKSDGYSFITHQSFIDCTFIVDLEEEDLAAQVTADADRDLKMISSNTREKILKLMENPLAIEGGIAAIIKKNLGT